MYFRDICCSQNQELHPLGSVLDTVTSHGDCIRINLICEKGPKVGAKVEYDCFKEGFDGIADIKDDIKNYMKQMLEHIQSNTCTMNITIPENETSPSQPTSNPTTTSSPMQPNCQCGVQQSSRIMNGKEVDRVSFQGRNSSNL